ncbi:hypothetical protein AJ79_02434 [Helicocarpus griseus UAMH5409]|uniref:Protein kinase domain-containing protein n=1 Tax=Helicocarpus griseus UAMH5409 TaxID=1447875 RepID=A0A2B7Y455_9EURO|nr:hypothetical protein AJ79_02434 [Helicocarpus griseus UAMH5409]
MFPMDDPTRKSTSKPMLRRFIHHDKPIKYLEFLGSGAEGVVYRVEIERNVYAIKILVQKLGLFGGDHLPERSRHYTCPIAHEARAFARLDSVRKNGTWAVKCHGWMKLSTRQQQRPKAVLSFSRWAIVKDYLPNPVTLEDIPEIRRKMAIPRKALMYPIDTQPRNYRGSFLVDLGSVRTYPYPVWYRNEVRAFWSWFDKYVQEWEVSIRDGSVVEGWLNERFRAAIENRKIVGKVQEARKMELPIIGTQETV